MKDEVKKIKEFFESINYKPLIILETNSIGEVDNGMGIEFDLPKYAVIHKSDSLLELDKKAYIKLLEFEKNENISLFQFSSSRCSTIDNLINELNSKDNYQIIWGQA